MCGITWRYGCPDPFHESRPFQDLLCQRQWLRIVATQQGQPLASMEPGDAGKKVQVVIDDDGIDRDAGYKNNMRVGHAQQHQQAKHPFLIEDLPFDLRKDFLV